MKGVSGLCGSLLCYTCKTKLSNNDCLTNVTCPTGSQMCKTDVISKRRVWGDKIPVWYQTLKGLTQRHPLGCSNRPLSTVAFQRSW
uniref:Snake toxin/toxin-like domain-containing protein n=1 Tax=Pelusios castaneus TaxID=367368 RepID=A0A8C8RFB5_9SAUR